MVGFPNVGNPTRILYNTGVDDTDKKWSPVNTLVKPVNSMDLMPMDYPDVPVFDPKQEMGAIPKSKQPESAKLPIPMKLEPPSSYDEMTRHRLSSLWLNRPEVSSQPPPSHAPSYYPTEDKASVQVSRSDKTPQRSCKSSRSPSKGTSSFRSLKPRSSRSSRSPGKPMHHHKTRSPSDTRASSKGRSGHHRRRHDSRSTSRSRRQPSSSRHRGCSPCRHDRMSTSRSVRSPSRKGYSDRSVSRRHKRSVSRHRSRGHHNRSSREKSRFYFDTSSSGSESSGDD
ncbi:serine/arginine repetitive matrix protein 5-like [Pecten maximus]|uniref:serine/arginine repetitive matrix protein 5-like n=1 Tax=Pecten maximus TaxID=6579 RepID=UPI0014582247|nr:serine/arginine repetitive matrix protein 5-like [Pecten maximus]